MKQLKRVMRHTKLHEHCMRMKIRLFWMHLEVFHDLHVLYCMTYMSTISKIRHMLLFQRVLKHIKLISMNIRLFWMHL
jgi:hypothetical protein